MTKCWCGRQVRSVVIREKSLADTAYPRELLCPEHGQWWREKDRPAES